jgi:hypothetical protein
MKIYRQNQLSYPMKTWHYPRLGNGTSSVDEMPQGNRNRKWGFAVSSIYDRMELSPWLIETVNAVASIVDKFLKDIAEA